MCAVEGLCNHIFGYDHTAISYALNTLGRACGLCHMVFSRFVSKHVGHKRSELMQMTLLGGMWDQFFNSQTARNKVRFHVRCCDHKPKQKAILIFCSAWKSRNTSPSNETICHLKTHWPTWSNSLQYTGRFAQTYSLNKDAVMSRNSVGQEHSFCLNGTVKPESFEANANYLQSRRCGAETKGSFSIPTVLSY